MFALQRNIKPIFNPINQQFIEKVQVTLIRIKGAYARSIKPTIHKIIKIIKIIRGHK